MAMAGEINRDQCGECSKPLDLEVLQSAAGFYIGTQCDEHGPNSRESHYFGSEEAASDALLQWREGNLVGKRDTDYHPGGMTVIQISESEDTIDTTIIDPEGPTARSRDDIAGQGHQQPSDVLTSARVDELMTACLYPDGTTEVTEPTIVAPGIMHSFLFRADRLEEHAEEIHQMLLELPEEFREGTEHGGWSFLNMCITKDGHQWTGLHIQQEKLMALGVGAGWLDVPLSKPYWMMLAGGVPYVVVRNERKQMAVLTDSEKDDINAQLAEQREAEADDEA
jgi:hypothetical protein